MSHRTFKPEKVPPLPALTPGWPHGCFSPIDLEIGAGVGLHAIRYARANPLRTVIAIEQTSKVLRLEGRLRNHPQIQNLIAIRANAIHWVAHHAPPYSLGRIFILYPNPSPKGKHSNLRWHNMPFMGFLHSRLSDHGELVLATNERNYHDEALVAMTRDWNFVVVEDRVLSSQSEPRTHFEKKYLARGETCWNTIFRKVT